VLFVDAKITRYLAAQSIGQKTAVVIENNYSGLQTSQITTLNDFSASVSVENQWWLLFGNASLVRLMHLL
jgi:hypothetical protein